MPPKKGKSSLLQKLGPAGRKAFDKHKGDETVYDTGGDMPPGVEDGVAVLKKCYFAEYEKGENKGEPYFLAYGVAISPEETEDGKKVKGKSTMIMEGIYATPNRKRKTVADHMDWVLNQMRMLGVDTSGLDADDLEAAAKALQGAQPTFKFRTWIGEATDEWPNPKVGHVWSGITEAPDEVETEEVTDDEDDEDDGDDDEGGDEGSEDAEDESEAEPEDEAEESDEDDGDDLTALGEAADGDDENAQETLQAKAEEANIDPNDHKTWADLAAAIIAGSSDAEVETDDNENWEPAKEDVYYYKPPKKAKAVECEVTLVNMAKKVVTLKNLDDGKTQYKGVPWDKLAQDE